MYESQYISIHAPREGSDLTRRAHNLQTGRFQSTLPARGATGAQIAIYIKFFNFNPRSPRGERQCGKPTPKSCIRFQSTLPARGATAVWRRGSDGAGISIHAPREGSDVHYPEETSALLAFQSTLPARGATRKSPLVLVGILCISIHAPREGSDSYHRRRVVRILISIHAPREGSDSAREIELCTSCDFNPRSPRGERRARARLLRPSRRFQSTLPARGATEQKRAKNWCNSISIHAPREGSDGVRAIHPFPVAEFQSTLPARGATRISPRRSANSEFQSTLPARGATSERRRAQMLHDISIHAPREGSDVFSGTRFNIKTNFNPRSPRGERRCWGEFRLSRKEFQSTLPARGATCKHRDNSQGNKISIHAPREGSDF